MSAGCQGCPAHNRGQLVKMGVRMDGWDHVVALGGNPNTGKSTVFNELTGLRQHTGNWPGKTVTRAEGGFLYDQRRYKLIDLPGTYSLLATSVDEEIARNFLLFGQPDVTVVVTDATRLERNLNLVLQVLEITDRVVVCVNLMDEAKRHGLSEDHQALARELGVPVVPTAARQGEGIPQLIQTVDEVATGRLVCQPRRVGSQSPSLKRAVGQLSGALTTTLPGLPNAPWVALRLLDGDETIANAVRTGELTQLQRSESETGEPVDIDHGRDRESIPQANVTGENILSMTSSLRWQVGVDFHQTLMETIYAEAGRIADLAVTRDRQRSRVKNHIEF